MVSYAEKRRRRRPHGGPDPAFWFGLGSSAGHSHQETVAVLEALQPQGKPDFRGQARKTSHLAIRGVVRYIGNIT